MWARRYDAAHKSPEEAAAGEAAVWWRNIWKLWETLIQVGRRDAVCLPQKSFGANVLESWIWDKGVATLGPWGLKDSVWKPGLGTAPHP